MKSVLNKKKIISTLGITIGTLVLCLNSVSLSFADHRDEWRERWANEVRREYPRENWGYRNMDHCGNVVLGPENNWTHPLLVNLGEWRHVGGILIWAEGMDRGEAGFNVRVNGDLQAGPFMVPGRDPAFYVKVTEAISAFELVHVSGGRIKILGVEVLQSERMIQLPPTIYPGPTYPPQVVCPPHYEAPSEFGNYPNLSVKLMEDLVATTQSAMDNYSNDFERVTYLTPLKKLAIRAKISAYVNGPFCGFGADTRQLFLAVRAQLELLDPPCTQGGYNITNDMIERRYGNQLAESFLTFKKMLDRILQ